ncbi:MAG: iron uptake porin [Kovacikia sp.]
MEELEQLNSVSQLSDVKPTDWAFQSLQSLVERYACIVGYPDKTFRGNRLLSRHEFAAGLNACMDRISELIAASTAELVKKEDLQKLQKLQEEFAAELKTLRSKVNALEVRTANSEQQQFSTTTKLSGELITHFGDTLGDIAGKNNSATASYRVRLDFRTSFTGKDQLLTRLQAANFNLFNAGDPNVDNLTGGFGAPQRFASTYPNAFSDETRLLGSFGPEFQNDSSVRIHFLGYDFPIGDRLNVHVHAGETDPLYLGSALIAPFSDFTTGAISNFANINPVYVPLGNLAGFGVDYKITDWLAIAAGYAGQNALGIGEPNSPTPSSGIFSGGHTAFSQLTLSLGGLSAGFVYLNTYTPQFGIDTLAGSNAAKVSTGGTFGIAEDDRVSANHFGFTLNYRINDIDLGGWLGYSQARVLGVSTSGIPTGRKGDVEVLNFATWLGFRDLGGKGNLAGLIFGMQPKVTDTSNSTVAAAIGLPAGERSDRDTGFHIEAFYSIRLNDHIVITPGVFWLTAPNHDVRNPEAFIGVIRTSFTF